MSNELIGRVPFINPTTFDNRHTHKPAVSNAKQKEKLSMSLVEEHREDLRTEDLGEGKDFLDHVLKHARNAHIDQQKHMENSLITKMEKGTLQDVAIEAKYIDAEDLGELVKYFEDGMSFEAVDSLVNSAVGLDDASAESEVAEFFNANNFNSAQIYMILNYMYDTVTKKYAGKTKLLNLIMKLIKQFENQESAYLFEFFSILRQPQLKANTALINGMALVNSGNAAIASVKSMLGFINDSLNGCFENIVSTCMKNRAHILKRLSGEKISFEQKSELAEYLRFEKTLIALHSTYMLAKRWRDDQKRKKKKSGWSGTNDEDDEDEYSNEPQKKLQARINKLKRKRQNGSKQELEVKKDKEEAKDQAKPEIMLELIEDDYRLVSSLSGFAESGTVSEMSVINLCKQIINGNSKIFTIGFLNRLIYFYSKLPSLVYGYSEAQQEKIVHGLRNCISQISAREKSSAKVTFSFLKKRDDEQTVKYTV